MLDMINNSGSETLILDPREVIGVLDLSSLGYYKINARSNSAEIKQIL